jgi:hypothetical protein
MLPWYIRKQIFIRRSLTDAIALRRPYNDSVKVAAIWLLLVAGALALIGGVASYDGSSTEPSIMVIGKRDEVAALDLPQLQDATFVDDVSMIPARPPALLFVTPDAAAALEDDALRNVARKGVAIGGLNVTLADLWRLDARSRPTASSPRSDWTPSAGRMTRRSGLSHGRLAA